MMEELIYIVALDDEKAAVRSSFTPDKTLFVKRSELYKFANESFLGGYINGGLYSCLYSEAANKFYPEYYLSSPKKLYHLEKDGSYTEIHARLALPICSIFATTSKVIIAKDNNAFVTDLGCCNHGFTGMTFSAAIWDRKLFLLEQSVKVFGSGMYFVNNVLTIVKSDMSLQYVYKTPIRDALYLEKKYNLTPSSEEPVLSDEDKKKLHMLQLYDLRKCEDGLYLDDVCIVTKGGMHK